MVIGSGIAGLTAALRIHAADRSLKLLVVTKDVLNAGSTQWAQGGIAAALGPGDTPDQHLARHARRRRRRVRRRGRPRPGDRGAGRRTRADRPRHRVRPPRRRALADPRGRSPTATGSRTPVVMRPAPRSSAPSSPRSRVRPRSRSIQHALAVDLLLADDGGVAGVTLHVLGEGQRDGVGAAHCRAIVLASGGLGQVFSQSTNPSVSTGDGMAIALRAGATLRDLEFVQFHPTVMYLGPDSQGQQPLISEAVRGEGAFLVDFEGNRFMQGQHELADLAPRDVVAKAITRRMLETDRPHMWLDARHLGAGVLGEALPHHPRGLSPARRRPDHRADPGRPRPALRVRRRRHRPRRPVQRARPLRHRRGRVQRRPRRQPARLQLPPRGARLLAPDRAGAAGRAPRVVVAGPGPAGRRPHRLEPAPRPCRPR